MTPAHVDGVTVVVGTRRRTSLPSRRVTGNTSTTQNGHKLAPEIVVEPAIEDRIGAGRAERDDVTHGKDEVT